MFHLAAWLLSGALVFEGGAGPGAGKHVVLVAGDEEYRSEEALPQLAALLATHHGFRCTVLFSVAPDGTIDPEARTNIPGLEALQDADLLVLFTRFRCLPDEDMQHLVEYVESGKPLIAIRTATHAFAYEADSTSPYASWSWDRDGGFGRRVLGETWVAHHGAHGSESTRGVVPERARGHPILRGVADVWGQTDVYAIGALPPDAVVLLEGEVLAGMTPDSPPVTDGRNSPRMPLAWARERTIPLASISLDSSVPIFDGQRVVCTTIGAAVDLRSEDLRRFFVNAAYWCVGLEDQIPERAKADIVGDFAPTMFGFGTHRRGVRPEELAAAARAAR